MQYLPYRTILKRTASEAHMPNNNILPATLTCRGHKDSCVSDKIAGHRHGKQTLCKMSLNARSRTCMHRRCAQTHDSSSWVRWCFSACSSGKRPYIALERSLAIPRETSGGMQGQKF